MLILLSTPITRKLLFLFSSRSILSQNCQSLTLSIVVWKTTSFPDILWKKKREEEKKKKAKQENTYSSFDISYRRAQSRKCNRRQWPGIGSSRHRVTAFKWQRRCLFGKRAINVGAERGGGIGHPPGKNVKATFSPIVARPPFSLACALAEDKCYSDFIRVRVSVATLLASQPGLFRVVREGLLFLWTVLYMCVYLYKTRYVPMKGSIRKSIVALLQRSFAVYRYVFAFIFPCFAVGHCLEMDVSISLVSCRRDYCINPSASLFFFSFFRRLSSFLPFFFPHVSSLPEEGEIGKLLGVTPLLYIIRFEGLLEAWIKLLNGRKTLLNVLCDIPLVSGIIHERFKSLNECFRSVVFNYISRRVCMYVYMLFIFVVKVI